MALVDVWTTKNVKLLGTMRDTELASRLGISTDAVFRERQRRGIPPFAPPGGPKKEGSTARTIRLSNTAWENYEAIGERKGLEPLLAKAAAKLAKKPKPPKA